MAVEKTVPKSARIGAVDAQGTAVTGKGGGTMQASPAAAEADVHPHASIWDETFGPILPKKR